MTLITLNDKSINYDNDWIIDFSYSDYMTSYEEKLSNMIKYKRE